MRLFLISFIVGISLVPAKTLDSFSGYLKSDIDYIGHYIDIEKCDTERSEIYAAKLPHIVLDLKATDFNGVYDLNNFQAVYLTYTFDLELNIARNIEATATVFQNIYSGEKVYDALRLNKLSKEILIMQNDEVLFRIFGKFISDYFSVLSKENDLLIAENKYKQDQEHAKLVSGKFPPDSAKASIAVLNIENSKKSADILYVEYKEALDLFLKRSGSGDIPVLGFIMENLDLERGDPYPVRIARKCAEMIEIQKDLNRDDFKPKLDVFATFGYKDNDMSSLEGGSMFGFLFTWNIFDGMLWASRNRTLDKEIERVEAKIEDDERTMKEKIASLAISLKSYSSISDNLTELNSLYRKDLESVKKLMKEKRLSMTDFLQEEEKYLRFRESSLKTQAAIAMKIAEYYYLTGKFDEIWSVIK